MPCAGGEMGIDGILDSFEILAPFFFSFSPTRASVEHGRCCTLHRDVFDFAAVLVDFTPSFAIPVLHVPMEYTLMTLRPYLHVCVDVDWISWIEHNVHPLTFEEKHRTNIECINATYI